MKILERLNKPFASVAAVLLVLQFVFLGATPVVAAVPISTIVGWSFPDTSADAVADSGISANATKTLTAQTVSNLDYASGGMDKYASATNWNTGDYWQAEFSTTGYTSLQLSSRQRSSDTGPRDFQVRYRVGSSGGFTDVSGAVLDLNPANNFETLNIALPANMNNASTVYLRWYVSQDRQADGSGTIATGGTNRIDDISVTGQLDSTPPTATVTYNRNNPTNSNVTATVHPADNLSTPANITVTGSSTYTFTSNGSYTFVFIDEAGNTGTTVATVDWIDKTDPTGATVIDNDYYGPNTYTTGVINGTASDANGITGLELRIQRSSDNKYYFDSWLLGTGWTSLPLPSINLVPTGTTSWSYPLAVNKFTNGVTYTVTPRNITDGVGNDANGIADSFTWDSIAPSSNVTAMSAYYKTAITSVPYISSDATSGVASVELYYSKDGGDWMKYVNGAISSFTSSPIDFDVSTTGGSGVYSLYTVATDNAGNVENNAVGADVTTMIDILAPSVGTATVATDFSPYVDGLGFDISAIVDDGPSGIDESTCEYTLDGTTWTSANFDGSDSANKKCYINGLSAADGTTMTLNFRVSDMAGNTTVGTATTRTADSASPEVTDVSVNPDFNGFTSATPTLVANITDTESGVQTCEYRYHKFLDNYSTWAYGTWDGNSNCTVSLSGLEYNFYWFQFRGTDVVGHVGDENADFNRIVDVTNPTNPGEPVTPTPTNETTQDWTWEESSDTGSGIAGYMVTVNDEEPVFVEENYFTSDLGQGEWTFCVVAKDNVGNESESMCGSVVVDLTNPEITLLGLPDVTTEVNEEYNDAGATALDTYIDGDLTSEIDVTSDLDITKLGDYTYKYDVSDTAGNEADQVTRTIHVVDTTKPVIKLHGANPETLIVGSTYTDSGAIATDNYDSLVTVNVTGSVNTTVVGAYTLTYSAMDSSGNVAIPVTRTVNVISAPTNPGTTLTPVLLSTGGVAVDEGAQTPGEVAGASDNAQTEPKTTNTEPEVKGLEDDNSNQSWWNKEVLGIRNWIWLLFFALVIGGWWFIASRRRRKQ